MGNQYSLLAWNDSEDPSVDQVCRKQARNIAAIVAPQDKADMTKTQIAQKEAKDRVDTVQNTMSKFAGLRAPAQVSKT